MNLFALDPEPARAARWQVDDHLRSQTKETAQLLSTALRLRRIDAPGLYKSTHVHHPCTRWVAESWGNWAWALKLGYCLGFEFAYRTGKDHGSVEVLDRCRQAARSAADWSGQMTAWPQAMPRAYRRPVADEPLDERHPSVLAYRDYYRSVKHWLAGKPTVWTKRDPPPWFTEEKLLVPEEIWEGSEW